MKKRSLSEMIGDYEFEGSDATASSVSPPKPAHMDIGQAKVPYDIQAELKAILNRRPEDLKRPPMPGDQPRAYAEGAPEAREIAMDASRASAENAETPEHKATRRYEGALAHTQDAVPFFPHIRGAVAGAGALLKGDEFTPAYEAETVHAAKQIEEAKRKAPETAFAAAPVMMAMPGGVAAKTAGGRIAGATALGSAYGADSADKQALTTEGRGATASEMLGPALIGAGGGLAGGLVGEAMRPIIRGAPGREDKAFFREVTRTEGGEGAQAMLAKNKEALVKDYENVIAQRKDPVLRAAVKLPEGKGLPVVQKKIQPYAEENAQLYSQIDEAARDIPKPKEVSGEVGLRGTVGRWDAKGENVERVVDKSKITLPKGAKRGTVAKWDAEGNPVEMIPEKPVNLPKVKSEPKRVGLMNASRLEYLLEKSKANVGPEAAARIDAIKAHLKNHWVPRVWGGGTEMPAGRFRAWLTSVQNSAASVPGSLNATASYQSVNEAMRESTRIFNEYLDSVGMPAVATRIRANNEQISSLSRIRDAMVVKAKKEQMQTMGLGSLMDDQQRQMERTAALWSAIEGKPVAAAAIMAKPYAEKGVARTYRWLNRAVLEPMELAAQNGATKAELIRFALEKGLPQGFANAYAAELAGDNTRLGDAQEPNKAGEGADVGAIGRSILGESPRPLLRRIGR